MSSTWPRQNQYNTADGRELVPENVRFDLAFRINHYQRNPARGAGVFGDKLRINADAPKTGKRSLAEDVVADARDQLDVRAELGRAYRLVRALWKRLLQRDTCRRLE